MFNKKSPILIVGFGSIGKRHYSNLKKMGYENLSVYDPCDNAFESEVSRLPELTVQTAEQFKVVLICSPNNFHIKHALVCSKAGCDLFIEKPLSHKLDKIDDLIAVCKRKKIINMVGCNMRFHPCLRYIKKYLQSGKLGKVYSIKNEFGYYLPYWRPGHDYRKNYAVKKHTGGGIILDDIHEFDLLFWLNDFNKVIDYKLISNRASNLKIKTEDQAVGIFKFKNKVIGTVFCDYLEQPYNRTCKIIGEKGNLSWDFTANKIVLAEKNKSKILFSLSNYEFNNVYIKELEYFLNLINKRQNTFNTVDISSRILKFCLK